MFSALVFAFGALGSTQIQYPETKKVEVVDDYGGISVPDPYRWLEEMDSPEVKAWVEAQNKLTFGYLAQIPGRQAIADRIKKLWNYERFGIPMKEGGKYFFNRNSGLQAQAPLYVADSLKGTPRLLIDPNTMSKDGTVATSGYTPSPDGKLLAYSVQSGGSDWQTWKVRDVKTGKDLADTIEWSKFSGCSWSRDGKGFYYSAYDKPSEGQALAESNYYQKLYYHRIGTPQSKDTLVYQRKDQKEWGFDGTATDDGRYLIITVWQGTDPKTRIFYKDLRDKSGKIRELLTKNDAMYTFIDNDGAKFWFLTDKDAPNSRVIAIDLAKPTVLKTIIPEQKESLQGVTMVGNRFFASYLKDAQSLIKMVSPAGKSLGTVKLPGIGSSGGFAGKRTDTETFYNFTGFTNPNTIYRFEIPKAKSTVFRQPKVQFDPSKYETRQVFYNSKDGTRVPMFITSKKGLVKNGRNPTLLYGYGGFNSPETPYFSVLNLVWMEMGGVYCVANLRGGGEYGKAWHDAGRLLNKQNVFDDFIAAAEWLINGKVTSTPKLAIEGASNGGLLVGAVLNQRPDLFGAALPGVGVMDMLRFNKFTIGWAWESDYGKPEDPKFFPVLRAYSPYHNVKEGTHYPATLITTGDHDDRVVPLHSFKYAAAMQAAQAGDAPILIRVETRAGHGGGKPTQMIIDEQADAYAFLVKALGMPTPKF
ncbi:MAG: prolyl oligopeptidase family serine peptidase [Fimbriimonadaceae bacterium]|nr:prolyl oligopeptidase family serine peptidase [Fimbriimonadaceae bacterium]